MFNKQHKWFLNWFNHQINLVTKYWFWQVASMYAQERRNRKNRQNANAANVNLNKEFAQNSIQWRVEDAKQAGIHPLYAMGASTSSPTASIEPHQISDNVGRTISNIKNDSLKRAQLKKLNAETDFINQQAEASKVAMRQSIQNSQQDDVVELEKYKLPAYAQESASAGTGGLHMNTPLGGLLYNNKQVTAQQLEDQTGEIVSLITSTMNTANAWGRYKAFETQARKKFPLKTTRRGFRKQHDLYNARQKNKRAHWLKQQIDNYLNRR